jgi:hypothetical protein
MYSFDASKATPLCEIMGRNKSDKGSIDITNCMHNYTTFYHSIFKDRQHECLRVFELGLGTNNINLPSNMGAHGRPGASVYGWREYFPNSQIFGADIDTNILFNSERIQTFYCDQTNKHIINNLWNNQALIEDFDIIVEDGLHEFNANVCFFENSIHKLKPNGYFIIEDVKHTAFHLFLPKLKEWREKYPTYSIELVVIPCKINSSNNNLIVIKNCV